MSRFARLRKHLSFGEAFGIYWKIKKGNLSNLHVSKLQHPFSMRNNPYDYATFEEVILRETYNISIPFTPQFILDGGGNIGLTAAYFASKYFKATILSVEPDKNNFEVLLQNTSPYKNIVPLNAGIWNRSTYLLAKDLGLGNNSIVVEESNENSPGAIPALSVSDLMQKMNWPRIDILKLDVEGAEKEIFSGNYQNWLPKTKLLIVEVHDRMRKGCSKAVFAAMSQYNFSFDIIGENLVFTDEDLTL
jgi:FkbM family methyltransferase